MPLSSLVSETKNISPDGHCGFRALSLAVTGNEDGWKDVCASIDCSSKGQRVYIHELLLQSGFEYVCTGVEGVKMPAPKHAWFQVPSMAIVDSLLHLCDPDCSSAC